MKLHFWGTRGSLPISLTSGMIREKIKKAVIAAQGWDLQEEGALDSFLDQLPFSVGGTFGGNTTCFEIQDETLNNEYILIDAGTGLREFGESYRAQKKEEPATFHIFVTHVHWDHIQGFPFFAPAYDSRNKVIFYGHHPSIPDAMRYQAEVPFFPLPMDSMGAQIEFQIQPVGTPFLVGGFHIKTIQQKHPGVSFGYRFEKGGKSIVISTDSEHQEEIDDVDNPFVTFFDQADLVVFDAQYTFAEATLFKRDWGHSSNVIGVELCKRAKVKSLCLVHHDPNAGDEWLEEFISDTCVYRRLHNRDAVESYPENIFIGYDSLSIPV